MNFKISALSAAALLMATGIVQAAPVDITTLPGYQVVTKTFNFGDTGWAGWSEKGKIVLGAKVISTGDSVSDFSVFKPVGPGTVTPFSYTYASNEYGFLFRDVANGAGNPGVQIDLYFADISAVTGYTITQSSTLNYGASGWGGWNAPVGDVVSGGGFEFSNTGASAASSQFADVGTVWPHYTFPGNQQGWVVQSAQVGGPAFVDVISFDAPASVPEPATLALLGLGLAGIAMSRRRKAS